MENSMMLIYALLFISILINILVCIAFNNKKKNQINHDSKIEAQLILIDRKLSELEENLVKIMLDDNISKNGQSGDSQKEFDDIDMMDIPEMAKKMNKSIKEVELMLKMRGLR